MKNLLFWVTALLLVFSPQSLVSQPGDLTQDRPFFEEKAQLYQRWLEKEGISPSLRVRNIEVQPNSLSLYLQTPYQSADSARAAWDGLKKVYDATHPLTLERELFYKMTQLMEVRQEIADVQVYDTYDLRRTPLFVRAIYFKEGKVRVEQLDARSQEREVMLRAPDPGNGKKAVVLEAFQMSCSRQLVFEQIVQFARTKYVSTSCLNRTPKVIVLEDVDVLRFEVEDLCLEVLKDEAQPLLCQMLKRLGYACDWAKRELLIFTVMYQPDPRGVKLSIKLDGKYGSGFYGNVRRGAYLDMEIDFDDYLVRYADQFKTELKAKLKCP